MADISKIAKNLQAFQIAVNVHDRENPTHTAWGIGLSAHDMERLGFEEGEEVLPAITIHMDGGQSGMFRVLCDGEHEDEEAVEEVEELDAVATQQIGLPGQVSGGPAG